MSTNVESDLLAGCFADVFAIDTVETDLTTVDLFEIVGEDCCVF